MPPSTDKYVLMPGISLKEPILYLVTPAVETIDLPGSHISIGRFKLLILQAFTTDNDTVLIHSSIEGGSSSWVYLIPRPPPTFNSFTMWPNFLACIMTLP